MKNIENVKIELSGKDYDRDLLINRIQELDGEGFDNPDYIGEIDTEISRYNKFDKTFALLKDGSKIVGYFQWYPITDDLVKKIQRSETIVDNEIEGKDINWPIKGEVNMFIMSVVISRDYGGNNYAKKMFDEVIEFLSRNTNGGKLGNLYAYAVSAGGNKMLSKFKMSIKKELEDYNMYSGKLSNWIKEA